MVTRARIKTSATQPFVLLPTCVNGEGPFDFVLDTGASMPILTEELARLACVDAREVKEAKALGAGKTTLEVQVGTVDSLSVGEARAESIRVGITDRIPKCVGARGALGYEFLKSFVLTVDYKSNVVTLSTPGEERDRGRSWQAEIPLRLARQDRPVLLVDVVINARETCPFILDTGASQTVVSPELARRTGIGGQEVNSLVGVGGATPGSVGILKSLSVGDASLRDVQVVVADIFSPLRQALDTPFDGILGFNFLSEFRLKLDYPNETILFE
jgi:predicted aspartyl protease